MIMSKQQFKRLQTLFCLFEYNLLWVHFYPKWLRMERIVKKGFVIVEIRAIIMAGIWEDDIRVEMEKECGKTTITIKEI